jgi:hypothetical protein
MEVQQISIPQKTKLLHWFAEYNRGSVFEVFQSIFKFLNRAIAGKINRLECR